MDLESFKKLELKIYSFSVNVFSFVKTLSNKNIATHKEKELLGNANQLYCLFLVELEKMEAGISPDLESCVKSIENCITLIKDYELSGILLNEKVDLAIDANQILRSLNLV